MIQHQGVQQQRRFDVERERWQQQQLQQPSVGEAISRVAEAGQNLIVDRIDLLKVEAKAAVDEKVTALTETGKSVGMLAVAGIIFRGGWVTLMVGLGFVLSRVIGPAGALCLIGGVHVLLAGVLVSVALKKKTTAKEAATGELRQKQFDRERPATAAV
jgi:hypothetical protein